MEDIEKEIAEIDRQRAENAEKMKALVLKKAKLEGKVVGSAGSLVCEIHGKSRFVETQRTLEWQKVTIFYCEKCREEKRVSDWNNLKNTAYQCSDCGIVVGKMVERRYDDLGPLCGSAGVEFVCNVCGKCLGRIAFTHA